MMYHNLINLRTASKETQTFKVQAGKNLKVKSLSLSHKKFYKMTDPEPLGSLVISQFDKLTEVRAHC